MTSQTALATRKPQRPWQPSGLTAQLLPAAVAAGGRARRKLWRSARIKRGSPNSKNNDKKGEKIDKKTDRVRQDRTEPMKQMHTVCNIQTNEDVSDKYMMQI